jgi:uncharacterized membrane protein YkoI
MADDRLDVQQGEHEMTAKTVSSIAIPVVLVFGLLGASRAVSADNQEPAYKSSVQVPHQNAGTKREERGERHGEAAEAARLASLTKIDLGPATAAALAQVPGKALRSALDDENGNVVYSVVVQTPAGEVKDVKVDAGTGAVLHVAAAGTGDHDGDED